MIKKFVEYFFSIFNIAIFRTSGPIRDRLYKNFFKKLKIYECNFDLIRIGPEGDGGYVIPNILNQIDYCYSPGVGKISEFEKQIQNLKIKCFLADKNVENPSDEKFKFNFLKKNLNSFSDNQNITLNEWVDLNTGKNNNLLLQMDIEGAEIDVILNSTEDTLKKFKLLIIEFHDFEYLKTLFGLRVLDNIFEKLNRNFTICHIHPNNCCGYVKFYKYKIPKVMEITFIRNDLISNKKLRNNNLPLKIDKKNYDNKDDLFLSNEFF